MISKGLPLFDERDHAGQLLPGLDLEIGHQDEGIVEHHLHFFDIGHHMMRKIAAIERHAFNDFQRRLDGVAKFHRDNSVIAGALEGFADHVAKRRVVGGNARNSPQASRPLQRSRRPS